MKIVKHTNCVNEPSTCGRKVVGVRVSNKWTAIKATDETFLDTKIELDVLSGGGPGSDDNSLVLHLVGCYH